MRIPAYSRYRVAGRGHEFRRGSRIIKCFTSPHPLFCFFFRKGLATLLLRRLITVFEVRSIIQGKGVGSQFSFSRHDWDPFDFRTTRDRRRSIRRKLLVPRVHSRLPIRFARSTSSHRPRLGPSDSTFWIFIAYAPCFSARSGIIRVILAAVSCTGCFGVNRYEFWVEFGVAKGGDSSGTVCVMQCYFYAKFLRLNHQIVEWE